MDNVIAFFTGVASLGYLGHSLHKYMSFNDFMTNGHHGNLVYLEGNVITTDGLPSHVQNYKGILDVPLVIKNTIVEAGKRKLGTHYYPVKIGNTTTLIPKNYDYTNWKITYNATDFASNIHFNNNKGNKFKLFFNHYTPFFQNKYFLKETIDGTLLNLHQFLTKMGMTSEISNKLRVTENIIKNQENVVLVGNSSKEGIDVLFIGSKNEVIGAVRKNIYGVKYHNVAFACLLFVVSSIIYNKEKYFAGYNDYYL